MDTPESPRIEDREKGGPLPAPAQNTQQTPPQAHQRPAWMTTEWLASECDAFHQQNPRGAMARLALHLDAELATVKETQERQRQEYRDACAELASVRIANDRLLGERNTARAELAKVRITTEQMGRPVAEDVTDWLWQMVARRNELRAERAAAIVRVEKAEAELAKVRETTESLRVCAEGWKTDCLKAQRELAERTAQRDSAQKWSQDCHDMVGEAGGPRGMHPVQWALDTLAERTRERDGAGALFQAAWGECAKANTERDAARADIAAAQMILPAGCGSLADAADTMRQDLEAARAEVERLKANALGWDEDVKRADEKCDAAIRDRNEFAAQQVERFAEEFLGVMKSHGVADAVAALPGAADNRAAELRAGAVPATDLPPPPHPDMELSGRMTIAGVRHRDGRAFKMVGAEGVGGRTNTVVIVVDDAKPATEPKPEPAEDPSNGMPYSEAMAGAWEATRLMVQNATGREFDTRVMDAVLFLRDAVEALAREVRQRAGGAS